jgi:hypothetical protein
MKLYEEYGPLIGGPNLVKVLGFRTNAAFRRAEKIGNIGVDVFEIEGRKGKFARTEDVEAWLNKLGLPNESKQQQESED